MDDLQAPASSQVCIFLPEAGFLVVAIGLIVNVREQQYHAATVRFDFFALK
jgi:hypothetical protein